MEKGRRESDREGREGIGEYGRGMVGKGGELKLRDANRKKDKEVRGVMLIRFDPSCAPPSALGWVTKKNPPKK